MTSNVTVTVCPECLRSGDCECAPPVNAHRYGEGEPFTNGAGVPAWVAWSRFSALYTDAIVAVYGDAWVWAWCVSIPEAGREWCTDY